MKHGMGLDGFVWFEGQVEDRLDPLFIGRVRVRCLGFDSEHQEDMPTSTLPWAYPLLPLNSDQGSVHAPKEGTWVFGFFRDGEDAQDRVVVGTINTGYNKWKSDPNDPAGTSDRGPAAILGLNNAPLVPVIDSSGASVLSSPDVLAKEMQGMFRDQARVAAAATGLKAASATPSPEVLKNVQGEIKDIISRGEEVPDDLVELASMPEEELKKYANGEIVAGLPPIGDLVAAGGALATLGSGVAMDGGSIQGVVASADAALGMADKTLDLVGGSLEDLPKLSEINLSDLDLSDVTDAAKMIGGEAAAKAMEALDKIPGGVEGLVEDIQNVDVGGLGQSGLNAGISMAMSQPEVQQAMAMAMQALNVIKTLKKTQETALTIIDKAKSLV